MVTVYLTTAAVAPYLSLACAAYGTVWRSAQIVRPAPLPAARTPSISSTTTVRKSSTSSAATPPAPKDKILFAYESNPAFFLQSGSIITSTSPGFTGAQRAGGIIGGQKTVKLTREEMQWVHDMVVAIWVGMAEEPKRE